MKMWHNVTVIERMQIFDVSCVCRLVFMVSRFFIPSFDRVTNQSLSSGQIWAVKDEMETQMEISFQRGSLDLKGANECWFAQLTGTRHFPLFRSFFIHSLCLDFRMENLPSHCQSTSLREKSRLRICCVQGRKRSHFNPHASFQARWSAWGN